MVSNIPKTRFLKNGIVEYGRESQSRRFKKGELRVGWAIDGCESPEYGVCIGERQVPMGKQFAEQPCVL